MLMFVLLSSLYCVTVCALVRAIQRVRGRVYNAQLGCGKLVRIVDGFWPYVLTKSGLGLGLVI